MLTMTVSYFNPRSREGSDGEVSLAIAISGISIHAPAKGATRYYGYNRVSTKISIHAPAKGATRLFPDLSGISVISIHAPAKGATGVWCDFEYDTEISIHAPAKGATPVLSTMQLRLLRFQSTLPRRERPIRRTITRYTRRRFQSTLPRRERRNWWCCLRKGCYFNPRSREGSDLDGELVPFHL